MVLASFSGYASVNDLENRASFLLLNEIDFLLPECSPEIIISIKLAVIQHFNTFAYDVILPQGSFVSS